MLNEDLTFLKADYSSLKNQKEKIESMKNGEISHLNEKNIEIEGKLRKLLDQNKQISSRLEESGPKIARYDELMKSCNEIKLDLDKAKDTINAQLNLILQANREKEEILSTIVFGKAELENSKNDKFFLSKENMTLSEKLKYTEDKV